LKLLQEAQMKHIRYYQGNDFAQLMEIDMAIENLHIIIRTQAVEIDTLSRALGSLRKRLVELENK